MEHADLLQAEGRDAEEIEDAGGILLTQIFEVARAAGGDDLADDRSDGLADARNGRELAAGDQFLEVGIERLDLSRSALKRANPKRIRLTQLDVLGDLVESAGDSPFVHVGF